MLNNERLDHERHGKDEGAALVMAIAFVTVIGLLLAGALSYAAVSMKASSHTYTPARDRLYGADAATKAAMHYVGDHPEAGQALPGVTCYAQKTYGTVGAETVGVQVCPQGVGAAGSFPSPGSVRWGLVTLATGSTKGLTMTGNNPFQINGNVYSNSELNVAGTGSLIVKQGSLYASSCAGTGTITVDGTKDCAATGAGTAKDPGFLPGITDAPADATVATACPSSGTSSSRVVQINPGKWTSAILTAATGCANVWLKPGIHYLENITWSIAKKVVAGALPSSGTSGIVSSSIPGGCDDTKDGAMLYLAGSSTVTVTTSGSLQVCGKNVLQTSGRTVEIPLYDSTTDIGGHTDSDTLKTGSNSTVTDSSCSTDTNHGDSNGNGGGGGVSRAIHQPAKVGDGGGGDGGGGGGGGTTTCEWSNRNNAKLIDTTIATDTGVTKSARTPTLTITKYAGAGAIPSSVDQLTVKVTALATRTSGSGSANGNYSIKVLNSDGTTACNASGGHTMATGSTLPTTPDTFTVNCNTGMTAPLQVEFYATASNSDGTRAVKLDGIELSYSVDVAGTLLKHTAGLTSITATTSSAPVWFGGEIYLPASAMSLKASALNGVVSTLGAVMYRLIYSADHSAADVLASANNVYTAGGDILVKTQVGAKDWVTCRIALALASGLGTPTLKGCTVPR